VHGSAGTDDGRRCRAGKGAHAPCPRQQKWKIAGTLRFARPTRVRSRGFSRHVDATGEKTRAIAEMVMWRS
jgi:hypothetical protein